MYRLNFEIQMVASRQRKVENHCSVTYARVFGTNESKLEVKKLESENIAPIPFNYSFINFALF